MRVEIQSRKWPLVNNPGRLRGFDNGCDSFSLEFLRLSPKRERTHNWGSVRDAIVRLRGPPACSPLPLCSALITTLHPSPALDSVLCSSQS